MPMPSDSRIAGAATAAVYRVFGFGHKGALEIKRRASAVVLVLFLFGNIASIVLGQTCANSACQACSAAYANALVGCALSGGSCASPTVGIRPAWRPQERFRFLHPLLLHRQHRVQAAVDWRRDQHEGRRGRTRCRPETRVRKFPASG